jgi:hypothetical protein
VGGKPQSFDSGEHQAVSADIDSFKNGGLLAERSRNAMRYTDATVWFLGGKQGREPGRRTTHLFVRTRLKQGVSLAFLCHRCLQSFRHHISKTNQFGTKTENLETSSNPNVKRQESCAVGQAKP